MNNAIELKDVTVEFAGFKLENTNMMIPKGVVVGLIGRNGAGKTTLIMTIADIYMPSKGEILYDGIPMVGNEALVKSRLGVVHDRLFYAPMAKASKVMKLMSPLYEDFNEDVWHQLMERFQLPEKKRLQHYSKGMQMKFMLTMVLARDPDILILDEPTDGMDPAARAELMELIQEFMEREDKTVIISTHITTDLDKIADYIVLMKEGRLVLMEEKETLLDHYGMVQVEAQAMNDTIKSQLQGMKKNSFGYTGLTADRSKLANVSGVTINRALLEDLIIYGGTPDEN